MTEKKLSDFEITTTSIDNLGSELDDAIVFDGEILLRAELNKRFNNNQLDAIFVAINEVFKTILDVYDSKGIKDEEADEYRYFPKFSILPDEEGYIRIYVMTVYEISAVCRFSYDIINSFENE